MYASYTSFWLLVPMIYKSRKVVINIEFRVSICSWTLPLEFATKIIQERNILPLILFYKRNKMLPIKHPSFC